MSGNMSTQFQNESIFSEAIFTKERVLRPVTRYKDFNVAATGVVALTYDTFQVLQNDKKKVRKEFPLEALVYYHTCLYWLRVLEIKLKTSQHMTDVENYIFCNAKGKTFNVLGPMFLLMRTFGKIETINGEILVPQFPELPTKVVGNIPGTWGTITVNNHCLYEEYPAPGLIIEAIIRLVDEQVQSTHLHYNPIVLPPNTTATTNLQGYSRNVRYQTLECKNFFLNEEIIDDVFPNIMNTGINLNLMLKISNYLGDTKVFKIQKYVMGDETETGSLAQLITSKPYLPDCAQHSCLHDMTVKMQSYARDTALLAAVSEAFILQPFKESFIDLQRTVSQNATLWCCVQFPGNDNSISQSWIDNRNDRRNLPDRFRVFESVSDDSAVFRKEIVSRLRQDNIKFS